MKYFLFFIFLTGSFSFCAGGNIKIKLNQDLSGEMSIYQKKIKKKEGGTFLGSGLNSISETEVVLKERLYRFNRLTEILPPGIRFIEYKEEGEDLKTILMFVDTSSGSKLLTALEIDRKEVLGMAKEAKDRDDLYRFNTLAEHIQFELFFPFEIKSISFTEQRTPGEWTARNDGSGKAVINLPLHSFWNNEYATTGIVIKYRD
ncbi:LBF_1134 family protein [Leptospira idonii]|uniref:Uncharacterized protein n=1 Tax=Leptospira idonii TaxID=1193500 RepID=A0A4R9M5R5_9LEPT|nr:hypothetical protein [Leptospira idonii]TGN20549.1 hypothetical protein EHS15_02850 [Leptospira idonii]